MQFAMLYGINALVTQHRLHWLGYVGRTFDRLLKQLLFGKLLPTRPVHGLRLRWRIWWCYKGHPGFGF